MLVIAGLEALVYFRIGSREAGSTSLLAVTHILGSIFYSILAVTLLPFASLSLFIYERQFYSGEVGGWMGGRVRGRVGGREGGRERGRGG
jgi:hypothetical protein